MDKHRERPENSRLTGNLRFCQECGAFYDERTGCAADIRFDERARVRRELTERIDGLTVYMKAGVPVDEPFVVAADLRAALDRICLESEA